MSTLLVTPSMYLSDIYDTLVAHYKSRFSEDIFGGIQIVTRHSLHGRRVAFVYDQSNGLVDVWVFDNKTPDGFLWHNTLETGS